MSNDALKQIKVIENELNGIQLKVHDLENEIKNARADAKRLEKDLEGLSGNVITKEKFAPYEKLLGVIGVAVVLAIVAAFMASILK